MKHPFRFLALILFATSTLLAQQPASSDAPASKEEVEKLFEVMQVHQQMRQVMDAMMKQQTAMIHETLKKRYPQTSADKIARADMIPIYQKHFSKADIEAMTTFYGSPTGQKMMQEMPALTTEAMQASYARMQKQMDAMMQRAEQIVKEEQETPKSTPATPTPQQKN
jgi:uncharacterized protein